MSSPKNHAERILSVSLLPDEHASLAEIVRKCGYQVVCANSIFEGKSLFAEKRIGVVFCATKLTDGTWRDLASHIMAEPEPPLFIVTSSQPSDHLWAEVLNLGGFDVLTKPFRELEVRRLLTSAGMRASHRDPVLQAQAAGTAA